ncbi:response regulator transcription factor [Streptomyces sp. P9(2023)]|uniref:helix-turn-helix transcriptional regulator n=1 Tax=Streptomyces sp. P9(2023) TaxID=3064394 RepID=UPI0028F45B68|nr:response regulator transcription factor [Streptomyces sp. P9(2023)]MDT9692579.1 response regulator transcription factor [Streptomyces sp. P9(2023)]
MSDIAVMASSHVHQDAVTVLVEPHTVTRMGLQRMLEEAAPDLPVVAVARAQEVRVEELPAHATVLLSVGALPGGAHTLDPLLSRPRTRLVLLVGDLDPDALHAAAGLPIDAVLRENDLSVTSLADLLAALRRGMVPVSHGGIRELLAMAAGRAGASRNPARPPLSARELDTLHLMSTGLSNRQIAKSMRITEHGVKRHVANILIKLGCHNRTMAVALGMRLELVDPKRAAGA